jgi:hypothetical protein
MDKQREAKKSKAARSILLEDSGLLGRLRSIHQKVDNLKVEQFDKDDVLCFK